MPTNVRPNSAGTVADVVSNPPRPPAREGRAAPSRTTIALKLLMAVSGIIFIGFVLRTCTATSRPSRDTTPSTSTPTTCARWASRCCRTAALLWIIRARLIVALVVHVLSAVLPVASRRSRARTTQYVVKKAPARRASLMMRWGGVTLLLFLVWHLLNFTIGKVNVRRAARPTTPTT